MPSHTAEGTLAVPVSEQRDHIRGSLDAPATIVEYGDFECPYCGQAHFILNDILNHFGNDVRLVFRHFPLTQIHPHAERAAEAAEAAAAQGRFWEMHDTLYENQEALDDASLLDYAQARHLDPARFEEELSTGAHAPRVREDLLGGIRCGVNGTPTFLINGRRHDLPWDFDTLSRTIESELARAPGGRRVVHRGAGR